MKPMLIKLAAAFTGFALASLLAFITAIAWQTFKSDEPPLAFHNETARAWPEGDDTIVVYSRDVEVVHPADIAIERRVQCKTRGSNYVYDLPPFQRSYTAGADARIDRVIVFPIHLDLGTPCKLETTLRWSPILSMNWHLETLAPIEFQVGEP